MEPLGFPPIRGVARCAAKKDWLDVGSGTGALCEVILAGASPHQVMGVDPSDGFVSFARHKVTDKRATFQIGDAQKLPVADGSFDATVAGLVINFITDQPKAVSEMKRVTRPLGVVGAYVWDYAGEMQMMRHFWDARSQWTQAPLRLTKAAGFLCAIQNRWQLSFGKPVSGRLRPG